MTSELRRFVTRYRILICTSFHIEQGNNNAISRIYNLPVIIRLHTLFHRPNGAGEIFQTYIQFIQVLLVLVEQFTASFFPSHYSTGVKKQISTNYLSQMQAQSKYILKPSKIIKLYIAFPHFFANIPPVKKKWVKYLWRLRVWPTFFGPPLIWGGGTESWRFFCACGGPPIFFAPGPSNGVKRVGT